ncbi:MAG: patatin-like phospholipase family protein [Nonomuraea sp.]|nr:patatin-like phospholipase family protein [Nonomuraea sp.]NUP76092.1 patatin-like phospholipase family protein [Nonomuraea sp.]
MMSLMNSLDDGRRALVLGGGGVAGIAWATGVLAGLADEGVDVRDADLIVGTSAGSAVGAQARSGLTVEELFQRQVDPAVQAREIPAEFDVASFATTLRDILEGARDQAELRRRIGAWALKAPTVAEAERRAAVATRLPEPGWPERPLVLVALDAETGETRLFDRASGVDLVDAVAASCAVPGIWPPVTVEGRRYVDGGVRSNDNADLASGFGRVLVLSPLPPGAPTPWTSLEEQVGRLREEGSSVEIVSPDEGSVAAMGPNPLDPSVRAPAAHAGREQGRREAPTVHSLWA